MALDVSGPPCCNSGLPAPGSQQIGYQHTSRAPAGVARPAARSVCSGNRSGRIYRAIAAGGAVQRRDDNAAAARTAAFPGPCRLGARTTPHHHARRLGRAGLLVIRTLQLHRPGAGEHAGRAHRAGCRTGLAAELGDLRTADEEGLGVNPSPVAGHRLLDYSVFTCSSRGGAGHGDAALECTGEPQCGQPRECHAVEDGGGGSSHSAGRGRRR